MGSMNMRSGWRSVGIAILVLLTTSVLAGAPPTLRLVGFGNSVGGANSTDFDRQIPSLVEVLQQELGKGGRTTPITDERLRQALQAKAFAQASGLEILTSANDAELNQLAGGAQFLVFGEVTSVATLMSPTGIAVYNLYLMDVNTRELGAAAISVQNHKLIPDKDAAGTPVLNPAVLQTSTTATRLAHSLESYVNEPSNRWGLRFQIEQQRALIEEKAQGKKMFWIGLPFTVAITGLGYLMDFGFLKMAGPVSGGTVMALGASDWVQYNRAVEKEKGLKLEWKQRFQVNFQ